MFEILSRQNAKKVDVKKNECQTWSAALASPRLAQVQAFMKLFLKFSDKKA